MYNIGGVVYGTLEQIAEKTGLPITILYQYKSRHKHIFPQGIYGPILGSRKQIYPVDEFIKALSEVRYENPLNELQKATRDHVRDFYATKKDKPPSVLVRNRKKANY